MEQHIDNAGPSSTLSPFSVDMVVGLGRKRLEAIFEAQSKLVDTLPTLSREWMSYAQAERELSSDLLTKLTAARSIPESAKVYQEWLSRRMDLLAEETRRMLADAQKLVDVGARLFAVDMAGRTPPAAEPTTAPGGH
jgi:phasin protein